MRKVIRMSRKLPLRSISLMLVLAGTLNVSPRAEADEASEALKQFQQPLDEAIDRGLKFLSENQKEDGLFPGQYGNTTAVAALTGMAYLSKGYTPGRGPYGEHINRCIDLVLKSEKDKDGKPTGYFVRTGEGKMYAHCISTLFLSEVSGMVDDERQNKIDDALPRALSLILEAQNVEKDENNRGGWRYEPQSRDSDLSLTGWAIMALRSARLNGAQVPQENIERAVEYILRCQPKDASGEKGFSYQARQGGKPAMTGVAILCLSLTGQSGNEMLSRAGDWILSQNAHKKWGGSHFYYQNYYCTQAMFQLGGTYWDTWATELYQNAFKRQNENGSWGSPYDTAMTVLALTVSYRQLPVYQR